MFLLVCFWVRPALLAGVGFYVGLGRCSCWWFEQVGWAGLSIE